MRESTAKWASWAFTTVAERARDLPRGVPPTLPPPPTPPTPPPSWPKSHCIVTFRKEGHNTFQLISPRALVQTPIYTHESYSHRRIMLPRRLLALLVIGGVLAVSAAYFRAGVPRISESPSKKALMTSSSEPPDRDPKHSPASMAVAMGGAVGSGAFLFDFLGKLLDHGTLVADDPVLSNRLLIGVVVVCSISVLISVLTYAFTYAFKVVAPALLPPPPLLPPPAGLAELLSCVDSSDTLEAVAAWCKATGVNHVTDLVGREQTFAMELSNLMPTTKRDALLEALAAVSAKHVGVWTRSDQDEAVEALKVLALAERMFRQSSP